MEKNMSTNDTVRISIDLDESTHSAYTQQAVAHKRTVKNEIELLVESNSPKQYNFVQPNFTAIDSTMSLDQIVKTLNSDGNIMLKKLNEMPTEYSKIFETHKSNMHSEQEVYFKDGQVIHKVEYVHEKSIEEFVISLKTIDDNYVSYIFYNKLKEAFYKLRSEKEIKAANILNRSTDIKYPIYDGVPLFSNNHPTSDGKQSNFIVDCLDETTLEAAIIKLQKFKQNGFYTSYLNYKIIVGADNQFSAHALINRINSAIRTLYPNVEVCVNQYLNDDFIGVMNNMSGAFKHYERESLALNVHFDEETQTIKATLSERYSFGVSNWRAIVGIVEPNS